MAGNNYFQAARGQVSSNGKVQVIADTDSPVVTFTRLYNYQSYFDSALLEKAIQQQNPQDPIATNTREEVQLSGYGIGLHPSSETPVAVVLKTGGRSGTSSPLVLKPGQVYFPSGTERGLGFSGLSFGLPFGWLGGGMATLVIYQVPSAKSAWDTGAEVLFHRQRMKVYAPTDLAAAPAPGKISQAPYNWPMRFPWPHALRGVNSVAQRGSATFAITRPTKVILALRGVNTLAAAAAMRLVFQATDDLSRDVNGNVVFTDPVFEDVTWPAFASLGGAGDLANADPVIQLNFLTPATRLAANDGGVICVDASGGALAGCYVDVVRYGHL